MQPKPYTKKLVCLANSRKYSGRCLAGKELSQGRVGEWIRPVKATETRELSLSDITLQTGTEPKLLDVITVPLTEACPHSFQAENHLINGGCWIWDTTLPISLVPQLCDKVDQIWENGYHGPNALNDRMPEALVRETISSSLVFIQPEGLWITVESGLMGLKKVRARFTFNGETYWLLVTDPVIEARYTEQDLGEYPVNGAQTFMTISIGEPSRGFCHKLAAGIVL